MPYPHVCRRTKIKYLGAVNNNIKGFQLNTSCTVQEQIKRRQVQLRVKQTEDWMTQSLHAFGVQLRTKECVKERVYFGNLFLWYALPLNTIFTTRREFNRKCRLLIAKQIIVPRRSSFQVHKRSCEPVRHQLFVERLPFHGTKPKRFVSTKLV